MRWLIVLLLVVVSISVYAEEKKFDLGEVVVTANRFEESVEETGTSVSIIDEEDIQEKGNFEVADLLRAMPGLTVVKNGGLGGFTSVYIRGAESYHTLVLIDGVEMNDPISPARTFDWSQLLSDDVEKIEIVRGPQSALYGSDAVGGVINIITKKGKDKPVVGATFSGGSYYTYKESLYSNGAVKIGDYAASLAHIDSEGFSTVSGGSEKDGYTNTTFNGKVNIDLSQKLKWNLNLRYLRESADLDNGVSDDDPNFTEDTESTSGKTGIEHTITDWWKYELNFSWMNIYRDDRNPVDAFHLLDDSKDWYDGADYKGTWLNTVRLGDISTIIAGIEYQEEQGSFFSRMSSIFGDFISELPRKSLDRAGGFIQGTVKLWERLVVTLGGRYENNFRFGDHFDYKAWFCYNMPKIDTRLKASVGTGFKAPTLYQLYSVYGSTLLQPEEVKSFDVGFEQPLFNERLVAGVTYFHNNFSGLIDWNDALWQYQNISKAVTYGIESEIDWVIISGLSAGLTYTYLHTEDESTGLQLDRRPVNTYGLVIKWYPTEKYSMRLDVVRVGERKDIDYSAFPYEQITLNDYTKVDLSLHYKIHPSCELFGRVENLLDEKYEEVYGFNTARISGYGGLKVEF